MSFHVSDPETDRAVRRLAQLKGKTLTETIREAVEHEYAAVTGHPPLIERIKGPRQNKRITWREHRPSRVMVRAGAPSTSLQRTAQKSWMAGLRRP